MNPPVINPANVDPSSIGPVIQPFVDQFKSTLQGLPWLTHIGIFAAMIAGMILWGFGRRLLRPAVVAGWAMVGLAAGSTLAPLLGPTIPFAPYVGGLVGMATGAIIGMLLYPLAVGILFGSTVGMVLMLAMATALGLPAAPAGADPANPAAQAAPQADGLQQRTDETIRQLIDRAPLDSAQQARVRAFVDSVRAQINSALDGTTISQRLLLGAAFLGGQIIGWMAGVFMPTWSAAILTSMAGAGVWLSSAVWLGRAFELPVLGTLKISPAVWFLVWAGATALGIAVQASGMARGKPKDTAPAN